MLIKFNKGFSPQGISNSCNRTRYKKTMKIIHFINEFLYDLFPAAKIAGHDIEALKAEIAKFYTIAGAKPTLEIDGELLIVDLNPKSKKAVKEVFDRAVQACENGNFEKAKPLLLSVAKDDPTHSEAYRILGQISSEEGDQDSAKDYLIEALRWNPKNHWALVMMGNIFLKYNEDVKTSLRYFEQAKKIKPNDHIILNNIGGNLAKQGRYAEAKEFLWDAAKINENFPNTHYALGLIAQEEGDLASSFYSATKALRKSNPGGEVYEQAILLAIKVAKQLTEDKFGQDVVDKFKLDIEEEYAIEIRIESDESLTVSAKLEIAEKYERPWHRILYRPYITELYWILNQLVVLKFILQNRSEKVNQHFVTNQHTESKFRDTVGPEIESRLGHKHGDEIFEKLLNDMYVGLNQQIFETPLSLFVENEIYQNFSELRACQFIALFFTVREGVQAATNEELNKSIPRLVLSTNRIFNVIKAHDLKDMYGLDLVDQFGATPNELRLAQDMYREFSEYGENKEPGDEFRLLLSWAKSLKISAFFELVPDTTDSQANNAETKDNAKNEAERSEKMAQFQKNAAKLGLNMAVVMYMVDALDFFADKSKDFTKKTAVEIAMLGTNGIQPEKQGYKLINVPGKTFSGFHLLAYYYVSFAIAIPEMLQKIQIPYDKEYGLALEFAKK